MMVIESKCFLPEYELVPHIEARKIILKDIPRKPSVSQSTGLGPFGPVRMVHNWVDRRIGEYVFSKAL